MCNLLCLCLYKLLKHCIYTLHRVVPVGEASVMIAASSEHRKEAIEAVAHAIDAVKATATIWKKVVFRFNHTTADRKSGW